MTDPQEQLQEPPNPTLEVWWSTNLYGQMAGWVADGGKRIAPVSLAATIGYRVSRRVNMHDRLVAKLRDLEHCERTHDLPIETCLDVPGTGDSYEPCAGCALILEADNA